METLSPLARRLALVLLTFLPSAAWLDGRVTATWQLVGEGMWEEPTNWNPQTTPANTNDRDIELVFGGGFANLSSSISLAGLRQTGGTINSATNATTQIDETYFFRGGVRIGGGLVIGPDALMTFEGNSFAKQLWGALQLTNQGDIEVTGDAAIAWGPDVSIVNFGTFAIEESAPIVRQPGETGFARFENAGLLLKTRSDGIVFEAELNSTGTVKVETSGDRLTLRGGGENSGVIDLSRDAVLEYALGDYSFDTGTEFTGSGAVEVSGANVDFLDGFTLPNLIISGGTLSALAETIVEDSFAWTAGAALGMGRLTLDNGSTAVIAEGGTKTLGADKEFWAEGSLTISDTLALGDRSRLLIRSTGNGLLDGGSLSMGATGEADFPLLEVDGRLTTRDTVAIGVPVRNDNSVILDSGTATISGQATGDGNWTVDPGASLVFAADVALLAGSQFAGEGEVGFSGDTFSYEGALTMDPTFAQSGGLFTGSSVATVGGLVWTGGTQGGAGSSTVVTGPAVIDGGEPLVLADGRDLTFEGALSTAGTLQTESSSTIVANGLWSATPGFILTSTTGSLPALEIGQTGSLTLDGGTGLTALGANVANAGSITVAEGILRVEGTFSSPGTVSVAAQASLVNLRPLTLPISGTLSGGGIVEGDVTCDGQLIPGNGLGELSITGNLSLGETARLDVTLAGPVPDTGYGVVRVDGDVDLDGTLAVTVAEGFTPREGDTFRVVNGFLPNGTFDVVDVSGSPPLGLDFLVSTDTAGVLLTATYRVTYDVWAASVFDQQQLANPDVSGPFADPDGDGQSNLAEYLWATNPLVPSPSPVMVAVDSMADPEVFVLTMPVRSSAADLVPAFQVGDLESWTLSSPAPAQVTTGDVTDNNTYRIPVGDSDSGRGFLRVVFELSPDGGGSAQ